MRATQQATLPPSKRKQLVDRITVIRRHVITDKAIYGFPKVLAASLADPERFGHFTGTLDWIVNEIAGADGNPLPSAPIDDPPKSHDVSRLRLRRAMPDRRADSP